MVLSNCLQSTFCAMPAAPIPSMSLPCHVTAALGLKPMRRADKNLDGETDLAIVIGNPVLADRGVTAT